MSRRSRRVTNEENPTTNSAYPGIDFRPLGRSRDVPLSGNARVAYGLLVAVLIAAFVVAVIWARTNS